MLKDLQIKDIYLGKEAAWLSGLPGTKDPVPAPADCLAELAQLRQLCDTEWAKWENDTRENFPVRLNEISYRASVMESLSDKVYVLRPMPQAIPKPEDLNLHPNYIRMLTAQGLTGLIIVAGPFGQGKTTTISSLISERLSKHGGVGITIEDPPEMPLEGIHGDGVCYQTWVKQGQFSDACRKAARWAPSMIFIGEVRDSETAAEALRASINGSLVLCTLHADSAHQAVERMYTLAQTSIGNPEDAAALLASGLLCVMHQRLAGTVRGRQGAKAISRKASHSSSRRVILLSDTSMGLSVSGLIGGQRHRCLDHANPGSGHVKTSRALVAIAGARMALTAKFPSYRL